MRETIHQALREYIVKQGLGMWDAEQINSAIDHWNEDRPPRGPCEFTVYDVAETLLAAIKEKEAEAERGL